MRSTWLASALLAAGCFSEAPSSGGCIDGEVACDCRTDGTCDAELECIASIDKCVPTDCTPGGENCTCVDGTCLGDLVCAEGLCMAPGGATTGDSASMSGSISDTVAETGTNPMTVTSASTDPTDPSDPSDPSNSGMTDSEPTTTPVDTGTTDESMSGSVSTDPTLVSESISDSDTFAEPCPACIDSAGMGECIAEYNTCFDDGGPNGCDAIRQCITSLGNVDACCMKANDENATDAWNELVDCAQMFNCAGNCHPSCG